MESKDLKTITIHQGQGDDELEMTVQVTQAEFDKMEEIRSKDPLLWDGKELDLVKAAKELIIKEGYGEKELSSKRTNWKLLIGVVLGIVIIIGTIIFAESKNKKSIEASAQSDNPKEIDKKVINEANRGELLYAYLKKNGFIASGSKEDFLAYIEDEERRMTLYEDMNDLGIFSQDDFYSNFGQRKYIIGCYSDFSTFLGYPYYNHPQPKTENMEKTYNKLSKLGSKGSFEEFIEYFEESDDNKKKVYEKLKDNGYPGTYDDFLEFTGYLVDWGKVLNDFISTKESHPNLTVNEWFERFPEFNDDESLLQAAFDYDATVKSGKYSDENELRSKFPEFWPQNSQQMHNSLIDNYFKNDNPQPIFEDNILNVYYKLSSLGFPGTEEEFRQYIEDESNLSFVYEKLFASGFPGTEDDFRQYITRKPDVPNKKKNDNGRNETLSGLNNRHLKSFKSKQYGFTYQYDDKEFNLVEKINKNTHCVMKLQSPKDEIKSVLVSVWENSDFSTAYDPDFIESCQSVDQGLGSVIRSAMKTKVGGVNALKSELKISPMGKSYYAAIYRIIHKKRMYMLNIYIPIEEYNKDKSYGDKCANNFKFN